MPRDILTPVTMKATGGAFVASLVNPLLQRTVVQQFDPDRDNEWLPVLTSAAAGAVTMIPRTRGTWSVFQLSATAVFFANALYRALRNVNIL